MRVRVDEARQEHPPTQRVHARGLADPREGALVRADVHDAPAGRPDNIVIRAMRRNPTVLLILSEHSAERTWMAYEIDRARKLKQDLRRNVLCLITLDPSWKTADWSEALADQVAQHPILDFSNWQEARAFDDMFARLIENLGLFHEIYAAE